jgi:uncharacterized protein (TIGR03083 family)
VGDETLVYLDATRMFAWLVERIDPAAWDGPGLGEWDLRALVGHTSRSLTTMLTYLEQPAATEAIASAQDYYVMVSRLSLDSADIVERGRQAGAQLGADPVAAIARLVEQVTAQLDVVDPDLLITTIGGGMRVAAYLPTRTFELAVHGLDICAATGLDVEIPETVLAGATELAARIAVALGTGQTVLSALTGRRDLPSGFSVVI